MGLFLGIDIGTSATKAIVIDGDGRVVGSGMLSILCTPRPNWAEQDPEDWWKGTVGSTRRAIESAGISGDDISGIGFQDRCMVLCCWILLTEYQTSNTLV